MSQIDNTLRINTDIENPLKPLKNQKQLYSKKKIATPIPTLAILFFDFQRFQGGKAAQCFEPAAQASLRPIPLLHQNLYLLTAQAD